MLTGQRAALYSSFHYNDETFEGSIG